MMKSMLENLKRMPVHHRAWASAKLGLAVWGAMYYTFPPAAPVEELGIFLNEMIGIFALVGGLISIVGLIMSNDTNEKLKLKGLAIEMYGLSIAILAPISYFTVQVAISEWGTDRIALCVFAYTFVMAFVARGFTVMLTYRGRTA